MSVWVRAKNFSWHNPNTHETLKIKANQCLPKKIQLAQKFFSFRPKPKINSKFCPRPRLLLFVHLFSGLWVMQWTIWGFFWALYRIKSHYLFSG